MAQAPDWGKGFAIGWKYAIFFMICFFVLGYHWYLSIFLGLVGLVATTVMGAWTHPKETDHPPNVDKPVSIEAEQPSDSPVKKKHFRHYGVTGRTTRRAMRRYGWLFKRK